MPDIKLITENLADELIPGIGKASSIYIMTSFVMESGVKLLASHLKAAVERGAEVKVLGAIICSSQIRRVCEGCSNSTIELGKVLAQ